jgi:hypothetical protein
LLNQKTPESPEFFDNHTIYLFLPFNSSFKINVITTLTRLTTNPPRNAFHQTGSLMVKAIPNDCPIALVNQNRNVLMTSVNNPNVRMINGQVNMLIKGLTSAFTKPKMSASQMIELGALARPIPGKSSTARYKATALIAQRSMNFVM